MRKNSLIVLSFLVLWSFMSRADEGMWIPMLLKKYNIEDMQQRGFKLTAEDIYDINEASLKDAIIGLAQDDRPFRHFCTGEFVSKDGLLLTNHHCVFGMVQSHTTLENNYLRDGFWAKNRAEELYNPGITASVLIRMEDVTEHIYSRLSDTMRDDERQRIIAGLSAELEKKATEGTNYQAKIQPYFNGNQFFMSVFKVYKDVRLVGAPPAAIGKFGGDTDNWTWPRHTGDFALLRVYAGENNEPGSFAQANLPYQPKTFFKLSTKGIKEGDFTMVFGYPGVTSEYLPSFAIEQLIKTENPHKIAIRTAKLNVINQAMNSDELLRIKYAAKAAGIANGWKKWQGEIKGLVRFNAVEQKQKTEADFRIWAKNNAKYAHVIDRYEELYQKREALNFAHIYASEAGLIGSEVIQFALTLHKLISEFDQSEEARIKIDNYVGDFYKNYDPHTDSKILTEMLKLYNQHVEGAWIPEEVKNAGMKNGVENYVQQLFEKSMFTNPQALLDLIQQLNAKSNKKLEKDGVYQLAYSIHDFYTTSISPELVSINKEITALNRLWLAGLMEMQADKVFYADANSTLRVAYGEVRGFEPVDAVYYTHYTTLKGIMEKDNPAIYDYDVPQKLRDIYQANDFGSYTQNGEVPVCFIANNHTTGGNSGSPVLNAEGHLIGINFDRSWEGVMSDLQYAPEICRNISVDIRYVLFIMDKLAGAQHLIDEMTIVNE